MAAVGLVQWGHPLGDPQQEAEAPDPPRVNQAGDRVRQWAEAEVEAVRQGVGPGVGVGVQLHHPGVGAGPFHLQWYGYEPCAFIAAMETCLLP